MLFNKVQWKDIKSFNNIVGGILLCCLFFTSNILNAQSVRNTLSLAGQWHFRIDSTDQGVGQRWFDQKLQEVVHLPGSMMDNAKGNDVTLETPWTASIYDSSFYFNPALAKYRRKGNLKIPFMLTPVKHYVGAAWYQREVEIPQNWLDKDIKLFLERAHWETRVWVDTQEVGTRSSLVAPHVYDLSKWLTPGKHRLTIRVDNRIKNINVGPDSHSITDQTQGNWNGIIGKMELRANSSVWMDNIQVYPHIRQKSTTVKIRLKSRKSQKVTGSIHLSAHSFNSDQKVTVSPRSTSFTFSGSDTLVSIEYPMGKHILKWDEFHPALYRLSARLTTDKNEKDSRTVEFGMRSFKTKGPRFAVNGRSVFLRGTVESCVFPKTGYPPMDVSSWIRIFKKARSYGLNHMRFHSWCPPEAAFKAADRVGFYLQPEGPSWANHGTSLGDGRPIDQFIYDETNRMDEFYGNHPSFAMMAYGNEPAGGHQVEYLNKFVEYWKNKDSRHVYTGASVGMHWPLVPKEEYIVKSGARGLPWSDQRPGTMFDHREAIKGFSVPYVAHEMGQYDVYPDYSEIGEYTGVHKAKNFEMFRDLLREHHMGDEAQSFLEASGKLQAICYKGEIEAALRTPGLAGFQLLALNDYPGQGTALVGVLNAFWESKSYISADEFTQFNSQTVPLAKIPKFVYTNDENFHADFEIAHFGPRPLKDAQPVWKISSAGGKVIESGTLPVRTISIGNGISLGSIDISLKTITEATRLELKLSIQGTPWHNHWNFWVYPGQLPKPNKTADLYITRKLNPKAESKLKNGGKVLLLAAGEVEKGKHVSMHFLPVFWNTSWFQMRPPHTLGIRVDNQHPAFQYFPTSMRSNFQWWSLVNRQQVMWLQDFPPDFRPLVQPIDTYHINRRLGLIWESKTGGGKLVVASTDLSTDLDKRPAARQLRYSILKYMASDGFDPKSKVSLETVKELFKPQQGSGYNPYTGAAPADLQPDEQK